MNKKNLLLFIMVALMLPCVMGLREGQYVLITLDQQTPDPVEASDVVELKFTVRNAGSDFARDVDVKLIPEYPFKILNDGIVNLGTLRGGQGIGEGVTVKFKVKVADDAPEGNHSVRLNYKVNGNWIETEDFIINVQTQDAIIAVQRILVIPELVVPGEEFKFKVDIKNFADSFLKDVRVKLNFSDASFSTLDETNEQVLKRIDAGQTVSLEFNVIGQGDVKSTIHSINIEITYLDNLGNTFNRDSKVGVKVMDKINYVINIDQTEVFTETDTGKVVFAFYNTGTSDINFVTMELLEGEDYEILSPKLVYLGNIESDDFESADYNLFVRGVKKDISFNLRVKYKDGYNQEYTKQIKIPLKIYSEKDAVKYKLKQVSGGFGNVIFGMISVLVLAFWLFMLVDCFRSKMSKHRKIVWMILIILSFVFGAVAYYFLARGKH